MPPRVFLTGFMGSGKSTVGPRLAERLGYGFVDLDRLVEERTGRSAAAWIARSGEAAFREAEAEALADAAARDDVVVATGGGALLRRAALELARSAGVVVYLRLSPAALAGRLAGSSTRPLLLGPQGTPLAPRALRARVAELLAGREPSYLQADLTVDVEGLAPDAVADAVARALGSGG